MDAKKVSEILDSAKVKAEAMRLRHSPLVQKLRKVLCEDKMIGEVFQMLLDYAILLDMPNLPIPSRYKDSALEAGTLLDIGIYPLT